jgi:hypothetical protein
MTLDTPHPRRGKCAASLLSAHTLHPSSLSGLSQFGCGDAGCTSHVVGFQMKRVLAWLALFLSFPLSARTQEAGTLTLVEGALRVIRGTTVLQAVEGMRLRPGDIFESSDPGFAQLEFPGGAVVALGSSSRLFLLSDRSGRGPEKSGGAAPAVELVLLSGWLKGEINPNAGAYRYATPALAATSRDGSVVLHAAAATEIFVESGSAAIGVVSPDGNLGTSTSSKAGQFFSRRAGKSVTSSPRPDPGFVNSMPRPFRDTLPSRLAHFAGKRPAEPRRDHEVTYAEVQPWLTAGHAWRRGLVQRFEPRLNDAEFRRGIEAHMGEHPEWDRILHPEKYQPKTPPPADNPKSQPGGE